MDKIQAITSAAKRLEAIINTATDGIITIDDGGYIDTINPSAAQLFGYQPKEVIGQKINMLMPPKYSREHDGYIDNYHRTGHAQIIGIGREVEGLRSDGTVFPFRLAVSKMEIDNKRMYTGIIYDLTDLKAAEARILELNRALEDKVAQRTEDLAKAVDQLLLTNQRLVQEIQERQAIEVQLREQGKELQVALAREKELHELKSRFVSMASHEFRTPLSTILTSAELIEMYQTTEQQPKRLRHLERIKTAVGNLNDVLNDFLSLSRLDEGKITAKMEWLPLAPFIARLEDELSTILLPGQELVVTAPKKDLSIFTDPKFLHNILLNLLSNASKYSPEEKPIQLRLTSPGHGLVIEIQDEGLGIPEQDQKHLFARFFRAHNVENIKGTGLGLHIVKRYLDLLNGTIHFSSELGKGSIFTIHLP